SHKMYFDDSLSQQLLRDYNENEEEEASNSVVSPRTCSEGHRSTLLLRTKQGGSICLLCFSNLISNSQSPTVHVSYALSQLSQAISSDPLSSALSSTSTLTSSSRLSFMLSLPSTTTPSHDKSSISFPLSANLPVPRSLLTSSLGFPTASLLVPWPGVALHCLGVLLNCQQNNPYAHIRDKYGLITNLVEGLQLPRDSGEILFVLYKVSVLQYASEVAIALVSRGPHEDQSDDVRLNCVAFLTVLALRGLFGAAYAVDLNSMSSSEGDSFEQATEDGKDANPMNILFTEAIKGPMLSTDSQVQISTLDLLFHYMSSWEGTSGKEAQFLVEENIADYVFEILRLSECKDPVVKSCVQVLDILSKAEQAFKQRLVVGFATLVPVLNYVADIPFHPVQNQTLKLILNCISDCPGMVSSSHITELVPVLAKMLKKHSDGEIGMLEETFILTCSVVVAIVRTPSVHGNLNLQISIKEAMQHAVSACLSISEKNPCKLLHSLFLLKEVYNIYSREGNSTDSTKAELRQFIVNVCTKHLLPWLETNFNEMDEETVLGDSNNQAAELAENLVSNSWFSLSFGCLGLFPTENMKWRVYLMLSSLVDVLVGNDSGQPIRDATLCLPSDPIDLLFLLGQKNSRNLELSSCQSAILLILYTSSLYDERLADDKLVLASLEQYILVNSSDLQGGSTDPSTVMRLVYLYGLYRGLAKVSYQIPYSPEAERILFKILSENEWDLPSARIHPISLKWLFQQEKLSTPLSYQLLKFCGNNIGNGIIVHGKNSHMVNINSIAELIAGGDNHGATLLVSLLTQLLEKEGHEHGIISVVHLVGTIIDIFPVASDQLWLHGIGSALRNLFCESTYTQSPQISTPVLVLIFKILCSVHHGTLSDDECWLAVTMKLINIITTRAADGWNQECLIVTGILCLILHHSSNEVLIAPSKAIILSTSLVSTINSTIHEACLKGPALVDHDEETSSGEVLIFVLLLNFFSLRSLHTVFPGIMDWKNFFDPRDRLQPISFIRIFCHDLCRLVHFGSPLVKLVASYCLLELFTRISDQRNRTGEELVCTMDYLMSVMAVLEGLIFYSDLRVAMNCGLCLSMILGWGLQGMQGTIVITKNHWSRMIVEELAMSLAVPCLASKSFINLHKPAIHVAVTLLKLPKVPEWMRSVFDDSCISGIIQNLAANNLSTEIVLLFRALLNSEYLKAEQICSVNQLLQACRKQKYTDNSQDESAKEHKKKAVAILEDMGEVCEYLIHLMSSESCLDRDSGGLNFGDKRLLEEIELFFKTSTVTEGN
ncbi:putative recombination initiation defect 1, partial [Prunus dulcis]